MKDNRLVATEYGVQLNDNTNERKINVSFPWRKPFLHSTMESQAAGRPKHGNNADKDSGLTNKNVKQLFVTRDSNCC
jgi:hypothetical protein